jgi:hypothetical protein
MAISYYGAHTDIDDAFHSPGAIYQLPNFGFIGFGFRRQSMIHRSRHLLWIGSGLVPFLLPWKVMLGT